MSTSPYYPLALGNTWTYKMKDGRTFSSKVTGAEGDTFTLATTLVNTTSHIKVVGDEYQTDSIEAGKWLATFRKGLKVGDRWQVEYKVNGVDTVLAYEVKALGGSKEVEGTKYEDVLFIEAESKMSMNGKALPMKYTVEYYYAKGIGLILTTSSAGDEMPLISCTLN